LREGRLIRLWPVGIPAPLFWRRPVDILAKLQCPLTRLTLGLGRFPQGFDGWEAVRLGAVDDRPYRGRFPIIGVV
jgi:hypothetical protein